MFLPIMTCRLMLSLKKAACEPTGLWVLSSSAREQAAGESLEFVSPTVGMSPDALAQLSGGEVELGLVARPS